MALDTPRAGRLVRSVIFREIVHASADYERELELRQTVLRTPLGLRISPADTAGEEAQRHFGLFAGDDSLVACVIAVPMAGGTVKIRQMAVAPEHRGQGHGKSILLAAERTMCGEGFTRATLHARLEAVGFYEKLGYLRQGDEFPELGIPHLEMGKMM